MKKVRGFGAGFFPVILLMALPGCADRAKDQAEVAPAIARLQSGEVIRQIEAARSQSTTLVADRIGPVTDDDSAIGPVADPCPGVANPSTGADEKALADAMTALGACMREQLATASLSIDAIYYFKTFIVGPTEKALSALTEAELAEFVKTHAQGPSELFGKDPAGHAAFRDRYSNEELDELFRLVKRRTEAYRKTELALYAALDARPALTARFRTLDRYALLLALKATVSDSIGMATALKIAEVVGGKMLVPESFSDYPLNLLHPFAIIAAIPDAGDELKELAPGENPFAQVAKFTAELAGNDEATGKIRATYEAFRDVDNPKLPAHAPAAADAVRVAFIDTGMDYLEYPDLALFAGAQHDYADHDGNSWVPAVGLLDHGSGTLATLLTIVAHHAPEILAARKLDLSMWKAGSLRSVLTGPPVEELMRFDTRHIVTFLAAILDRVGDKTEPAPHIVSISAAFPTEKFIQQAGKPNLIQDAPWLWVMAAGNEGEDVTEKHSACFDDVPAERRAGARILCVGALLHGIVNDKIMSYSNFGDRVDVYAYESYTGMCPNGTSCATPAISAAATAIAAKFPSLSPEQIKEVIVESAVERTLAIDYGPETNELFEEMHVAVPTRTVKVFDPVTMLPQALTNAAKRVTPLAPL